MKRRKKQRKNVIAKQAVTCLVTGFDAFGGQKANPSSELVEAMPPGLFYRQAPSLKKPQDVGSVQPAQGKPFGKICSQTSAVRIKFAKKVLPTASRSGWRALKQAIDTTLAGTDEPLVLVMPGLAASRDRLSLERFALNVRDYGMPDNEGELAVDTFVDPEQPDLLRTMLPLPPIVRAVEQAGYPCQVSNHAGTYICNELYFKALSYCRRNSRVKAVVFVHIPPLDKFAATAELYGSLAVSRQAFNAVANSSNSHLHQLDLMRHALETIVKAVVETMDAPVPVTGL